MGDPASSILEFLNSMQLPLFIVSYPDLRCVLSNEANNREIISPLLGREVIWSQIAGKALDEVFADMSLTDFKEILHRVAGSGKAARFNRGCPGCIGGAGYEVIIFPIASGQSNTSHIAGIAIESPEEKPGDVQGGSLPLAAGRERVMEHERLALLGQLTFGMAHEIKNPLTVISGFAEVTKGKVSKISGHSSIKESIEYYQREIIDNCNNINRLIVDLLQLARPRKTEKVRVNMASTLEKICNILSPYAMQRNVTLLKDLLAADIEMYIDPIKIRQVLLNLCNNAVQSMGGGGILWISTTLGSGHLVVRVSDTGSGIRPENMDKLGTPFYTTKSGGTGLGLNVTYDIVREHSGKIEVESEIGKGTTFSVYLPLEGDPEGLPADDKGRGL